ncbi:uncharacterized protein EI90DRAFT_3290260 [Cantharellus anzutake]|uniref:uncharacterized protein n=1 Tax=Cantharellus anzutake TaxID=1750568 RepID=UPI0019039589|nr:uncharacterized protein EI90DRAFT_3290260 [Cantharellus anzutake]KAF8329084.1 hypothetical protein EI90DRAFT_3290260 [Cantharellus anzutake]
MPDTMPATQRVVRLPSRRDTGQPRQDYRELDLLNSSDPEELVDGQKMGHTTFSRDPSASLPYHVPPLNTSTRLQDASPRVRRHLHGTQDLFSRLQLVDAYTTFVRPYVRPSQLTKDPRFQDEQEDGNRIPHGLKTFLADLPGRTSTKKSSPIADMMMIGPRQHTDIMQLDARTIEHFKLPEGLLFRTSQSSDFEAGGRRRKHKRHPDELENRGHHDAPDMPSNEERGPSQETPSLFSQPLMRKQREDDPHNFAPSPMSKRRKLVNRRS